MTVSGGANQKNDSVALQVLDGHEIELKLLGSPDALASLLETPIVARNTVSRTVPKSLEATYYDTPERDLLRQEAALRVRRSGKRHVQTLKLASGNGAVHRLEYETAVPDMAPALDALPLAELGAPFDTLTPGQLGPVFTTKVRRQTRNVSFAGSRVEIAFDEGALIAGERTAPLCEMELELKSGEVGALYELALSLLDHGAFHIGPQSKGERGYALALGARPSAKKAFASGIEAADTADQVIAKTLIACQRHVMANLAAARQGGDDPEGVHQLRVALRRLRSAIRLFGKEVPALAMQSLAPDARRLASALGPARNWDVFLIDTVAGIAEQLPDIDFDALRSVAAPFRARSHESAGTELAGVDCTRFLLSLGRVIERRSWRNDIGIESLAVLTQPAQELAARALGRLARKAAKQGKHLRRLEPEARHELRLTLKKLRYSAEFFLPLYGEDTEGARKYLKALSRLQNILGADNDATTTRGLLHDIEAASLDPQVHRAVGAITGWQARAGVDTARELRQAWRRFAEAHPFWE